MTHYHDGQSRTIDYRTDGRMSIDEIVSLLKHLNNDYQRPWVDSLYYRYSDEDNRTYIALTTTNDRPHKWSPNVVGGNGGSGESGETTSGGTGSDTLG